MSNAKPMAAMTQISHCTGVSRWAMGLDYMRTAKRLTISSGRSVARIGGGEFVTQTAVMVPEAMRVSPRVIVDS